MLNIPHCNGGRVIYGDSQQYVAIRLLNPDQGGTIRHGKRA